MKKITIYIFTLLLLLGCNNPKKRSQDLIRQFMNDNLNDFNSYEPIKFGTLDSLFSSVMETDEWKKCDKKYLEFEAKSDNIKEKMDYITNNMGLNSLFTYHEDRYKMESLAKMGESYTDSMIFYNTKMQILYKSYKKTFKGWSLIHTYRAKNAFGNTIIKHTQFKFDKDVKSIIGITEQSN